MKINISGLDYELIECEMTFIDDDCIVFSERTNKIMVLNSSGVVIWKYLVSASEKFESIDIQDIILELSKEFDLRDNNISSVYKDIEELIEQFIQEGFLNKL